MATDITKIGRTTAIETTDATGTSGVVSMIAGTITIMIVGAGSVAVSQGLASTDFIVTQTYNSPGIYTLASTQYVKLDWTGASGTLKIWLASY